MPNWCENNLKVRGKKEDVEKFDERFKSETVDFSGVSSYFSVTDSEKDKVLKSKKDKLEEKKKGGKIEDYRISKRGEATYVVKEDVSNIEVYEAIEDRVKKRIEKMKKEAPEDNERDVESIIENSKIKRLEKLAEEVYEDPSILNLCDISGFLTDKEREKWLEESNSYEVTEVDTSKKSKGYSFNNFVEMTKEDFLDGWYDWAVEKWGTKWDLDSREVLVNTEKEKDGTVSKYYNFMTAWAPPEPVVMKMIEEFPSLEFELVYSEEGIGFAGKLQGSGGEITNTQVEDQLINVRRFIEDHIDDERYGYHCEECGCPLEEYEWEEEEECPYCEEPMRKQKGGDDK